MAIYHFTAKIIQRSKGQNAVASAAYRHATRMFAEKENRNFDYSNKKNVIHNELLIPTDAPSWIKDIADEQQADTASEALWNVVEDVEKRKDAQLAREIEFALPIELSQEQNLVLAREYLRDQLVSRGMVADFSIHWEDNNPHVHALLSTRHLSENGFGQKAVEWNSKELLCELRQKWSEYANFHLRLHAHDVHIDHRSYADQGIRLIPGIHEGKAVNDMTARGLSTNIKSEANEIRLQNLALIKADPTVLLEKVSAERDNFSSVHLSQEIARYSNVSGSEKGILANKILESFEHEELPAALLTPDAMGEVFKSIELHESVFSEKDIARALAPWSDNSDMFARAIAELKSSPELISLGYGDDGRARYTTRGMFELENSLQVSTDILSNTRHTKISAKNIEQTLSAYEKRIGKQLTDEQNVAVRHILNSSSISCLVGRAGTGKSFSLGAAREVWESEGLTVVGVALSGIAADGLTKDANITSRTIESFRFALENKTMILSPQHVVVMDEAGMTDSVSMHAVLQAVQTAKAKVVLVGDYAQIQPVGPGASFRAMVERLGFAEIQTVYRQKTPWQRDATHDFSAGRVAAAMRAYEVNKCVQLSIGKDETMAILVSDVFATRAETGADFSQCLVVAHKNEDVSQLNQLIRNERIRLGELSAGHEVIANGRRLHVSEGDRLLFLKNDRQLGVSNGRFATIKSIVLDENNQLAGFQATLDGSDKDVFIDTAKYNQFALGYAATVHKVQGMTVDNAFVYASGHGWTRHLTYVAMSRHRNLCRMYADNKEFPDFKGLVKSLSKMGIKDSLLDYPLAFATRRGIETAWLIKRLPKHLATRLNSFKQRIEETLRPELARARIEKEMEALSHEVRAKTREDARLVAAYVDTNRDAGVFWKETQQVLYGLGLDSMPRDVQQLDLITKTREYQAFQAATQERNAKAFEIIKDPARYQKALDIYQIDIEKLERQASTHEKRLQVEAYLLQIQKGSVIHRDKMAAIISSDIKGYYPVLKSLGVDTRGLRTHAVSHLRRQLRARLPSVERSAFLKVEAYNKTNQKIGALYAEHMKNEGMIKREYAVQLQQMTRERDALAFDILSNRERYSKALDFHQIGVAAPHFQDSASNEQHSQAQARWHKLQGHAVRHEYRSRIEQYMKACKEGNHTLRLELAADIRRESKAHYAVMMQMGLPRDSEWSLTLWKDEARFKRYQHLKSLPAQERTVFKKVEAYVAAKRAHATAWREIFETKNMMQKDDELLFKKLPAFVKPYTKSRNELAASIQQDPERYAASLAYFKIDALELNDKALSHQCESRAANFAQEKDIINRARIAQNILADLKTHGKALHDHNISFKSIYQLAAIANKKDVFSTLSSDEKRYFRLLGRYQKEARAVGKTYGALNAVNSQRETSAPVTQTRAALQRKLSRHVSARNNFAHKVVGLNSELNMMEMLGERVPGKTFKDAVSGMRVSFDKVTQHADRHQTMTMEVTSWYEDYQKSLVQLAEITSQSGRSSEKIMHQTVDWLVERKDKNLDALTKTMLTRAGRYQAVFNALGINKTVMDKQQRAVGRITDATNQWLSLTGNVKQASNKAMDFEDRKRLQAVQKIVSGAKPVAGTLAERYLRAHRGIEGTLNSKAILYHPNLKNWMTQSTHPALLVLARDKDNKVCGLQAIFLDPKTANKADLGKLTKLSRGFTSEGSMIHQGHPGGKVAMAEGAETALSIATAHPDWTVYMTFGVQNFEKVAARAASSGIVICADNDGLHSGTDKAVKKAAEKIVASGKEVSIALPDKPANVKKYDFNDVLKKSGVEATRNNLEKATPYKSGISKVVLEREVMDTTNILSGRKDKTIKPETLIEQREPLETPLKPVLPAKSAQTIEQKTESLDTLLTRYVDMVLKQDKLVKEKHTLQLSGGVKNNELSLKVITHSRELKVFAVEVYKHPEVQACFEAMKNKKPSSLVEHSGFLAIRERIGQGGLTQEDRITTLLHLRGKVREHSLSQKQDRQRGGRAQ